MINIENISNNLIRFVIIMKSERGIMDKDPYYIMEKYNQYVKTEVYEHLSYPKTDPGGLEGIIYDMINDYENKWGKIDDSLKNIIFYIKKFNFKNMFSNFQKYIGDPMKIKDENIDYGVHPNLVSYIDRLKETYEKDLTYALRNAYIDIL